MRNVFSSLRSSSRERRNARSLQREWERLRWQASTPSERAEIDAIFSRHIA